MRSALALTLGLLLTSAPALAQEPAASRSRRAVHGDWANLLTPPRDDVTRRDAQRFVRQGLFYLLTALGPPSVLDDAPSVQLDRALVRFERAQRLLPDDVDLAYYTAVALDRWERPARDGGMERRVEESLAAWHRVRELDPEYAPARVAFALALLHARRQELEEATAEYEIALATDVPESAIFMGRTYLPNPMEVRLANLYFSLEPATVHNNLAENLMLLGDLDGAIAHYQRALSGAHGTMSRALTTWGLALAQHRAGEPEAGLSAAREAITLDPVAGDPELTALQERWGALAVLHHPEVFFEPVYELHAYQAVGYEAYASAHERWRRAGLESALTSWRRFLAEGGVASRFAAHARAQITRLEAELAHTDGAGAAASPAVGDSNWIRSTNEPWLGRP